MSSGYRARSAGSLHNFEPYLLAHNLIYNYNLQIASDPVVGKEVLLLQARLEGIGGLVMQTRDCV